ncbi:MAG: macro domain-containing protein [Gammaproteobacteria bacterium]
MIHEVTGDILLTRAQALAHGVAPNDHFSSGLALALREAWPSLYKDFRHYCQTTHVKPGEAWSWMGSGGRIIINLLTQQAAYGHGEKPGRATVAHVNHALRALRQVAESEKLTSLALPRIATGVGGLDWTEVEPLVHQHLGDLNIPVVVYTTYRKGVQADERIG